MLLQIITHTPKWVFAMFALLLWLGIKQLTPTRPGLTRITLMPVAMLALSVYGVLSTFGEQPLALAGFVVAALATATLVLLRPLPAAVTYNAAKQRFSLPGSAVPLVLMMGIFCTKYAVGVALTMQPALAHQLLMACTVGTLYGAFSGVFAARALRLWKLALQTHSTQSAALA